jgi:amino acid adenylation domain-containing protein
MISSRKIPLTQSQTLIWAGQALAADCPLYNMVWRFDFHGAIDPARFALAFQAVVAGSDALAARFVGNAGLPDQIVPDDLPPFPKVLDFSDHADPQAAVAAWIDEDAARPIDLSKASFRTRLIRLGDRHWVQYFNQHHIATDAISGALVFRAVARRYKNLARNDAKTEPNTPQFADFARRERAARADGSLTQPKRHWEDTAAGKVRSSAPYGQTRDASLPISRRISIPFGKDRSDRLRHLATDPRFVSFSADLSVFGLLATVYAAYLARVTGDAIVRIGAPSHNRTQPQDKETIGLFIEMYPITVVVEPDDTFTTLFQRVLEALFVYLRNAKPGASSVATAGLFHAVLNYMPVAYGDFAGVPTDVAWLHPGAHDGQHDIRLHVYDFNGSGRLTVEMDFNAAVFDPAEADQAAGHFLTLFDALLADGDAQPAKTALLGDAARPLALADGPPQSEPSGTILDGFRRNVAKASDAAALTCGAVQHSYGDLDRASDSFAARLQDAGVQPGDGVAIIARRTPTLVACMIGTLKAGAYFVPISADTPVERVGAILSQLRPACIVVDEMTAPHFANMAPVVLNLANDLPHKTPVHVPVMPTDLAYVIYTSGSTGTPKGVAIDHDGLSRYIEWAAGSFGDKGAKDYPLCTSIGFDLTITSLFVPLFTGGQIRIYTEPKAGTDLSILKVFADDAVDVVKLTPSHLALVCAQASRTHRIGTLVLGGENLGTALCRQARKLLSDRLVIANEYGPTEAVVGCMIHRFDPGSDTGASVPIGRPANGMSIYVLDDGNNPVPVGVIGQIHIGGAGLAVGYHGDPDQTAQRFVADPFAAGQRMYRTGDLARVSASGVVHYLGRADQQLKLSGIRVEAAEIENALCTIDGMRHAHVELVAPDTSASTGAHCLRCGLSDRYPDTKIGDDGICHICRDFDSYKDRADAYFQPQDVLAAEINLAKSRKRGKYDAIMLLSGGKDSAYAIYRLADLTKDILAITLDNGFISAGAKENIQRICADIGVDHRFVSTPAMNEIFRDSLKRFSNVCQGCFKTIYAMALKVARDEGIPAIVTGLSRGQFFETRLTPDLFKTRSPSVAEIETLVMDARKSYHRMDDAVSKLLQTDSYIDDQLLEDVRFIDLYRYIDVPVSEIYAFLREQAPWIRPEDTGRSTNCLINDLGIYFHKAREGYHNYELPYSWDVRLGHKTRLEAMAELDDEIDPTRAQDLLQQIGWTGEVVAPRKPELVAYIVADRDIPQTELRREAARHLPREAVPAHFIRLDALPLTSNGKVDTAALPKPGKTDSSHSAPRLAAETETERHFVALYKSVIGEGEIGVTDNFYDIGGDSIAAIQIALSAAEAGYDIGPTVIFEHQTIRELAHHIANLPTSSAPATAPPNEPLVDLSAGDMAALGRALSRSARKGGA